MYKLHRLLIIGILTFVLVSACRGNVPQQTNSQADNTSTEAVRVVNHATGKTEVPIDPQRVVVLSIGLDTVLSLGVKPVGSIQVEQDDYYLKDRAEGVESVGNFGSPNLEAIAALKPDLILGSKLHNQIDYKLLSQIAPTIIAEVETGGDWKKMLNQYAEALGKTDKAEQIMADYHAKIEKFQAQMGDRLNSTEVSIVRISQRGISLYLKRFSGTIVADAGLPRPPHQTNTEQTLSMEISKELLHKADGDVIFVWTASVNKERAREAQTALKQLKADPLWSKLNAVQQDKVYEVPSYWIGTGPFAANLVLDDLFKYLVPQHESNN